MTRIDFYVLDNDTEQQRLLYCCKLVEKVFALGHKIFIHTSDDTQARQLDELLWSANPEGYLPHEILTDVQNHGSPITLGPGAAPGDHHDVMINLSREIPADFSRFDRLAEVVCQLPEQLESSREHWVFYRDRGYPLESHSVSYR